MAKKINDIIGDNYKAMQSEIQQLRKRVAELEEANKLLEADARRYRYLKTDTNMQFNIYNRLEINEIDEAIDIAMENKNDINVHT